MKPDRMMERIECVTRHYEECEKRCRRRHTVLEVEVTDAKCLIECLDMLCR